MINARQKGHQFERQIAREFQDIGFDNAMTTRAARGGDFSISDDGVDLVGTEPFAIQCKRLREYVPVSTIEEIVDRKLCHCHKDESEYALPGYASRTPETHCYSCGMAYDIDQVPILITKADHKPAMAVIPWDDLKRLIGRN